MKELEGKLGKEHLEFRKGRGTEEVYIMNNTANREVAKKRGKVFYANLKSAFDKIDRHELNIMIIRNGIGVHLKKRILEIYKETGNVVRIGGKRSIAF